MGSYALQKVLVGYLSIDALRLVKDVDNIHQTPLDYAASIIRGFS